MIKMLELNIRAKKMREELYNEMKDVWNEAIDSYEKLDTNNKDKVLEFKAQFEKVLEKYKNKSKIGKQYCTMLRHNFDDKFKRLKKEVEKL